MELTEKEQRDLVLRAFKALPLSKQYEVFTKLMLDIEQKHILKPEQFKNIMKAPN